jgi:hypothetical protein
MKLVNLPIYEGLDLFFEFFVFGDMLLDGHESFAGLSLNILNEDL